MRFLLLVLSLACTPPDKDLLPTGGDDSAATNGDPDLTPLEVEAFVAPDMATVVIVRWRTESPTAGYVEFGEDTGYRLRSNTTAEGTDHEVRLLGLYADTEFHFRVVSTGGADEQASGDYTIATHSLPPGLFPLTVSGEATDWSGYQVLPLQGNPNAVVMVDTWGRYVWYYLVPEGGNLMRGFLSADRESVVLLLAGPQSALEEGKVVRVSLDGATVTETPVPYADHDLAELPDGTLAAIIVVPDGEQSADSIVEIARDGSTREIWSAWDAWDPAALGIDEHEHNWTHGNALDYVPEEDAYYLSMKTLESLAKIDRATGEVQWTINGRLNEFSFGDTAPLGMHHQFEVQGDDRIVFFENGSQERQASRLVELQLDVEARTATEIWSYTRDPSVFVFAKGDVHRFDNGNTQVVWSTSGEIQNVTPEGEVTWQLNLGLGQVVTFVHVVDSLYVGG